MNFKSSIIIAAVAMTAVSVQATTLNAFVEHPTHCTSFVGGDHLRNESVSAAFSQELSKVLDAGESSGKSTKQTLAEITAACAMARTGFKIANEGSSK